MPTQTPTKPRPKKPPSSKSKRSGPPELARWLRSPRPEPFSTKGDYVIRWIEANCCFTDGEWIGQPFKLLQWQKVFIYALFAQTPEGQRRYRWALLGVPKKNGKTELAAALALYFLIGDGEPSPLVVCAAASDDQADLVYGAAKTMCELSPTLERITERFAKVIYVPSIPGARLQRVAAASGTNDGKNIHAVVCDELHEWAPGKGEKVWNVLTNGTGARRQPMVLQITTAGFDKDTVCYRQYDQGRKISEGLEDDPTFLMWWIEANEKAAWTDLATVEATNPSYGAVMQPAFYTDQMKRKPESIFRRYFCNQWMATMERWIPMENWDACAGETQIERGDTCYLSVAGDARRQTTAIEAVFPKGNEMHVLSRIFNPPEGDTLEPSVVEQAIRDLTEEYYVSSCSFRSANFYRSAQLLEAEGIPMVQFPYQAVAKVCAAAQELYDSVMQGRLVHDGDVLLRKHADAAVAEPAAAGWRLQPAKATEPIEAMEALAAAIYDCITEGNSGDVSVMVMEFDEK